MNQLTNVLALATAIAQFAAVLARYVRRGSKR
jgi:hypothetical protein